jgi:hypothetical protein
MMRFHSQLENKHGCIWQDKLVKMGDGSGDIGIGLDQALGTCLVFKNDNQT